MGWWPLLGTGPSTAGELCDTGCRHCRTDNPTDLNAVTLDHAVEEKEVVITSYEAHDQQY